MTSTTAPAPVYYRRKIHYVDESIQKWLLMALVVLETALAATLVWFAHWRLHEVIEQNLYRVHVVATPLLIQLLQEASLVLGAFLVVNVLALLAAQGIWGRYVNSVRRDFTALIGKTARLDFSPDLRVAHRHEVLDLAGSWRARERTRLAAIRQHIAQLEAEISAGGDPASLRAALNRLNELLR